MKAYLATILKALLVAIKTVVISSTNAICAVMSETLGCCKGVSNCKKNGKWLNSIEIQTLFLLALLLSRIYRILEKKNTHLVIVKK